MRFRGDSKLALFPKNAQILGNCEFSWKSPESSRVRAPSHSPFMRNFLDLAFSCKMLRRRRRRLRGAPETCITLRLVIAEVVQRTPPTRRFFALAKTHLGGRGDFKKSMFFGAHHQDQTNIMGTKPQPSGTSENETAAKAERPNTKPQPAPIPRPLQEALANIEWGSPPAGSNTQEGRNFAVGYDDWRPAQYKVGPGKAIRIPIFAKRNNRRPIISRWVAK